jgi:hypothetical protein
VEEVHCLHGQHEKGAFYAYHTPSPMHIPSTMHTVHIRPPTYPFNPSNSFSVACNSCPPWVVLFPPMFLSWYISSSQSSRTVQHESVTLLCQYMLSLLLSQSRRREVASRRFDVSWVLMGSLISTRGGVTSIPYCKYCTKHPFSTVSRAENLVHQQGYRSASVGTTTARPGPGPGPARGFSKTCD